MGSYVFWLVVLLLSCANSTVHVIGRSEVCTGLPGLLNCSAFLLGGVSSPDANCCNAVAWLSQHATKREDKMELCRCLKDEDLKHKGVDVNRARTLPDLCQVQLPVPLIPDGTEDCDKYSY